MEESDDTRLEPTGKHWETGMPDYCTATVTRGMEIKQLYREFEWRENITNDLNFYKICTASI